jgi:2,3-bisphosphoglycerate-dependent phosphoglycerate mutase
MDRILVLARHGQSEWNLKNLFTGWRDVGLTDVGIEEARRAGRLLRDEKFKVDVVFTSLLSRAQKTASLMLDELGQVGTQVIEDVALNERDYGDLTGLNKEEAARKWGKEQVLKWRRSYDIQPPGGESLKDTVARTLPYYVREIQPRVLRGETVLVAAHGNSLRALVMVLERHTTESIIRRELATGVPIVYRLNADSTAERWVDLGAETAATAHA